MAHYEGETLKQRIARGPLVLDDAIDIATQVGQGLAEAHGAGIVHREYQACQSVRHQRLCGARRWHLRVRRSVVETVHEIRGNGPVTVTGLRRAVCIAIVVTLCGLITHGTHAGTGDEPHYQIIAHSIAFDRDIALANNYADRESLVFAGQLDVGQHALPGRNGQLRPVHDIGLPLLVSPYYALAHRLTEYVVVYVPQPWLDRAKLNGPLLLRHLMSFAMICLTAWISLRLFALFTEMSGSPKRSALWAVLLTLSPPLFSHAFLFFTEILSAFVALVVLVRLRTPTTSRWEVTLLGVAAGALLLIHARNIGLVVALVGVGVYRLSRGSAPHRLTTPFVVGVLMALAARVGVTYHFWGTWLTTPHARLGEFVGLGPTMVEASVRTLGWLFDQEHGLLLYGPVYVLAPLGWCVLWRRDRELCSQVSILVGAYVGVMALPLFNLHGWRGGWTPAARFLVPIVPMLAIGVFAAITALPRGLWVIRALVGLQLAIVALLWQQPKLLWNDGNGTSTFLEYLGAGSNALSRSFPSVIAPFDVRTAAMIAIATGLWFAFSIWLLRLTSIRGPDPLSANHPEGTVKLTGG